MPEKLSADTWVWVIVIDPESQPQYLGQQDDDTSVAYIPTFMSKEDAQQGVLRLALDKSRKIEIQAVMYDQLVNDAAKNDFHIFVINTDGAILERISSADAL